MFCVIRQTKCDAQHNISINGIFGLKLDLIRRRVALSYWTWGGGDDLAIAKWKVRGLAPTALIQRQTQVSETRVKFRMHVFELRFVHVGVDLRGRHIRVAEQFLDDP